MKHLADENWKRMSFIAEKRLWTPQDIVFETIHIVRDYTANNIFKTYCRMWDFMTFGSKPILCVETNSVTMGA